MKKFTLMAMAVVFTLAASAQKVLPQHGSLTRSLIEKKESSQRMLDNKLTMRGINAEKAMTMRSVTPAPMLSNGMTRVGVESSLITETPAGREVVCSQTSGSYYVYGFYTFWMELDGGLSNVVYADDNTVYIKNPFGSFATGTWLKGTINGDEVTIPLPQTIYQEEYYGEVYSYQAERLVYNEEEGWYYQDGTMQEQNIMFTLRNDSLIWNDKTDGDIILGITSDGEWVGYGDHDIVYAPMNDKAVEAPAGLQTEEWAMTYDGVGHFVKVGFDGGDVYVGNMYETLPDGWIKGKVNGDKVVFESDQYIGPDEMNGYHAFFKPATSILVYDEYYNEYYPVASIEFAYDAEKKTMTSDSIMVVNAGKGELNSLGLYEAPAIKYQEPITGAVKPATPTITEVYPYDFEAGYGYLSVEIPMVDVDGRLLDADKLHYNMFVDDEIVIFYPDEYSYLTEEMTDIPYNFYDDWDFYYYGSLHYVYFYFTGYDKIGIRTTYTADNGETADSDIAWYGDDTTGISALQSVEPGVKNVTFTDLSGRRADSKAKGLLIKTVTYDDGTVKSFKYISK